MADPEALDRSDAEAVEDQDEGADRLADRVRRVQEWLEAGDRESVANLMAELHVADIGDVLEQLGPDERYALIDILDPTVDAEAFTHLSPSLREEIFAHLPPRQIARILSELDSDDALDLIQDLDASLRIDILEHMSARARRLVEEGLEFPEYSAGRLMQREVVAVPQFWTVGRLIDYLRAAGDDLPEQFYDVFIVDPMHRVVGMVPLARILRSKRGVKVDTLMEAEEIHKIPAVMDQEEVAYTFRQYGLVSAPVVDDAERLLGVITVDDVVDVIDEEAEEDILKLAGVPDADLYRAVLATTKARFSWLAVNLLTAIIASAVIALFEATIEEIVALAVLMPIVASMGGNAGTQTLAVAVRALATRELTAANALRVITRETVVGAVNGVLFAVLTGTIAALWFADPLIGAVIGLAMIVNLFVAGLAGTLIPLGLARIGVDPALASTVFLTTVTDVVGFFAFLGLAGLVLL